MKFSRLLGISVSYSKQQSLRRLQKLVLCSLTKTIQRSYSLYTSKETIFSLSSGHGKCGVAVIRVSGIKAVEALKELGRFTQVPKSRVATLRTLYDNFENVPIDNGLILWFPGMFVSSKKQFSTHM